LPIQNQRESNFSAQKSIEKYNISKSKEDPGHFPLTHMVLGFKLILASKLFSGTPGRS